MPMKKRVTINMVIFVDKVLDVKAKTNKAWDDRTTFLLP